MNEFDAVGAIRLGSAATERTGFIMNRMSVFAFLALIACSSSNNGPPTPPSDSGGPVLDSASSPEASTSTPTGDASLEANTSSPTVDASTPVDAISDGVYVLDGTSQDVANSSSDGGGGGGIDASTGNGAVGSFLTGVTAITAGSDFTCALRAGGTVECWGDNTDYDLGNGTMTPSGTPVAVTGLSGVISISAEADSYYACALLAGGTVDCWGTSETEVGAPSLLNNSQTPTAVAGISGATAVMTNGLETCVLLAGASVQCLGYNSSGQLGDGTTNNSATPVSVTGITGATSIAIGSSFACALLAGGTVQCWGNIAGLGTPTYTTPVAVTGLTGATSISATDFYACAILTGGTVQCWGYNGFGALGDGTMTSPATPISPVTVSGLTGASSIFVSQNESCAVVTDGTVQCWGQIYNSDGSITTALTPITIPGVSGATSVTGNHSSTCALVAGGMVVCWGENNGGNLGDGTLYTAHSTPVTVVSGN